MFNLFSATNHQHMAVAVRETGPYLVQKLLSVKRSSKLNSISSTGYSVTVNRQFDQLQVIESSDLYAAIRSGAYSGVELTVLKYLAKNFDRVGERVGSVLIYAGRYGTTAPYSVIYPENVATYTGEARYPAVRGSYFLALLALAYFGTGGFLAGGALASYLAPGFTLVHFMGAIIGCVLLGLFGFRQSYQMSVDQNKAK